jgi:hypothetical protein
LSLRKILALHEHLLDDLVLIPIVGILHDLDDFISRVLGFTCSYRWFFVLNSCTAGLSGTSSGNIWDLLRAILTEMPLLFTCKAFSSLHEFGSFIGGNLPGSDTVGRGIHGIWILSLVVRVPGEGILPLLLGSVLISIVIGFPLIRFVPQDGSDLHINLLLPLCSFDPVLVGEGSFILDDIDLKFWE